MIKFDEVKKLVFQGLKEMDADLGGIGVDIFESDILLCEDIQQLAQAIEVIGFEYDETYEFILDCIVDMKD